MSEISGAVAEAVTVSTQGSMSEPALLVAMIEIRWPPWAGLGQLTTPVEESIVTPVGPVCVQVNGCVPLATGVGLV